MKKFLHKTITPESSKDDTLSLQYFLLEENLPIEECTLKCYGVEIRRTFLSLGFELSEIKQIPNIFLNKYEATKLLKKLAAESVPPTRLSQELENYISDALHTENRIPILI